MQWMLTIWTVSKIASWTSKYMSLMANIGSHEWAILHYTMLCTCADYWIEGDVHSICYTFTPNYKTQATVYYNNKCLWGINVKGKDVKGIRSDLN